MSCGVGYRHGSDLALLWLSRKSAATALIRPLAWEPPYAMGVALKKESNKQRLCHLPTIHVVSDGLRHPDFRSRALNCFSSAKYNIG